MRVLYELVKAIDAEFYFGIGGLGDFLLLMSTFYDKVDKSANVIFVANNTKSIRLISRQFPRVKIYTIPMNAWDCKFEETWQFLMDNKCIGTGVTPKNFMYIADWMKCGETNCFEYYGVDKHPLWANSIPNTLTKKLLVIQPCGGFEDKTKVKKIDEYNLAQIIEKYRLNEWRISIVGLYEEISLYKINGDVECFHNNLAWDRILMCDKFIGVDSWGKTLAKMADKETIVYRNSYNVTPMQLFGTDIDPGDNVFLKDWGFIFVNQ